MRRAHSNPISVVPTTPTPEPTQEQIDRIAELFLDISDEENLPVSRLMPKPKKKKLN